MFIFYFAILGYLITVSGRARTSSEFSVGSREIPGTIVFATLSATFVGPGYSMGLANKVANNGIVWLPIFAAFSLQTVLVGLFVASRLRQVPNAKTLGDVMGNKYGRLVQVLSGALSVALCAGIVGAIARAGGDILNSFTGLPIFASVVITTATVIVYSWYGGIKTVILTDTIQFIIFAIAIPFVAIGIVWHGGTGIFAEPMVTQKLAISSSFGGIEIMGMFLAFLLGETLIPPYANRALVARNPKSASNAFIFAGIFSLAWFTVCALIGILFAEGISQGENVFLNAVRQTLPSGLIGLVYASMACIIMSSQDSLLNAASVSFTNDIVGKMSSRSINPRLQIALDRWLTLVIGVVAVGVAITAPNVIDALMYCYTLWAPTVVLPLILAVTLKRVYPYAGFAAILAGGITTIIWEWGLKNPFGVPSILLGIIANQVAFWALQLLSRPCKLHPWFVPITTNNEFETQ